MARLLVAVVGTVTTLATIKILGEQSYRAEVFRLYVNASRHARGATSVRRTALEDRIKLLSKRTPTR